MSNENRRDVKTRKINLFQSFARMLVQLKLTPNQVSVSSAVFALIGAFCFAKAYGSSVDRVHGWLLVGGVFFIQIRLLCNLMDGLMAVEFGKKTPAGEIFNDVPDRIADVVLILGAGMFAAHIYSWMMEVAWAGCIFAVLTAYIRLLGASMTGKHDFSGPMAKQHRMFILSLGGLGSLVQTLFHKSPNALAVALIVITVGSAITCARRLVRLNSRLNE